MPLKPANTLKDRVADRTSWEEVSAIDTLEGLVFPEVSPTLLLIVQVSKSSQIRILSRLTGPSSRSRPKCKSEECITPSLSIVDVCNLYFAQNATKAPSTRGQLTCVMETQSNARSALFCGRPSREAVLPASQYDETLTKFRHNLDTIVPTPSDVETFISYAVL